MRAAHHDDEDFELGRVYDHRIVRKLFPFLRPYRIQLVFVSFAAAVYVVAQMLWPQVFAAIAQSWGVPGELGKIRLLTLVLMTVALVGAAAEFVRVYLSDSTTQRLVADMRAALYFRFQRLPMSYFDRIPTGKILSRLVNDADALESLLESGFVSLVGNGLLMTGVALSMLVLNWRLALVGFSAVPLVVASGLAYRPHMRRSFREVRTKVSQLNARIEENLAGHSTVLVLNQEARCAEELETANQELRAANTRSMLLQAVFNPFLQGAFGLGLALVLWYGGTNVIQGRVTIGELVAFIIYMNMFGWPLQEMMERIQLLQAAMASLERIFGFLEQEGDDLVAPSMAAQSPSPLDLSFDAAADFACRPGSSDPFSPRKLSLAWATSPTGNRPCHETGHVASALPAVGSPGPGQRATGDLEFRDVWFAYREGEWVLKGLSFHAKPGQRIAIAGPTGCGKTTILSLAGALYRPQRGSILLDGRDTVLLDPRHVRRQIVTVLQDVFLFNDVVDENVRLWEESISRETVELSCIRAQAHGYITKLPHGYGQSLGERGATLSAGQRQLLSFARALAYDPPILILDEATSSVDAETEEAIRRGLIELTRGRTTLVVAHRFSTLADADLLLIIRDGRVFQETTPREFLATKDRGAVQKHGR